MKKSPYFIFFVLAIVIIILAILYQFGIISEWKLAVITISSVLYSLVDVIIENRFLNKRLTALKELSLAQEKFFSDEGGLSEAGNTEALIAALDKIKAQEDLKYSWFVLLRYIPFVLLIVGLSIDKKEFNVIDVNTIAAFGVAISCLSIYQQKASGDALNQLEKKGIQVSERLLAEKSKEKKNSP